MTRQLVRISFFKRRIMLDTFAPFLLGVCSMLILSKGHPCDTHRRSRATRAVLFPATGRVFAWTGKSHRQYANKIASTATLGSLCLSFIAQPRAVHCRLSCRKATSAVVLTIHPQLARAKRRLRVPGSKIAYHRRKAMRPSEANKNVVACLKQLVGRHR